MSKELNEKKTILESLLFIAGDEGLSLSEISDGILSSKKQTLKTIKLLQDEYAKDSNKGLNVAHFNNKYFIVTKSNFHPYLKKVFDRKTNLNLSVASLEVLAIIAYYGPISRRQIEQFRGVNSDGVVYNLKSKDIIEVAGKEENKRSFLYKVSNVFFQTFQINSIDDLPSIEKIINDNKQDESIFDTQINIEDEEQDKINESQAEQSNS